MIFTRAVCFEFAEFELDVPLCQLRRWGQPVPIQPKVFKLLRHLVQHHDRVVSNAELLDVVWPDEKVTLGSVKRAVREARRALHDSGAHQSAIQSVRGFGYRFVAPLSSSEVVPAVLSAAESSVIGQ